MSTNDVNGIQMIYIAGPLTLAIAIASLVLVVRLRRKSTITVDRDRIHSAQAGWRAPDGLANASLPRAVQFTSIAWFVFGVAVLVVAGGGVMGWYIGRVADRNEQATALLQREGVAVQGSIVRKWRGGGRSHSYNVAYTYPAPDGVHSTTSEVTTALYNRVSPGSPVQVTYAPSNPGTNHIESSIQTPPWLKFMVLIPILVFVVIPYVVLQQKKLLAYGSPAAAVVESVAPVKGGWMVTYQFLDARGETVRGRCNASQKPNAGETITVVYNPDRPKTSSRYPLKYVKLEDAV